MAFIPDAVIPPYMNQTLPVWRVDLYDTTMIIPISQTCRRLRDVAVGCPFLWTSVANCPRVLSQTLAQRSQGLPSNVSLPVGNSEDYDLVAIAEDLPTRLQELHVGQLPCDDYEKFEMVTHHMFSNPLPMLESLSVKFRGREGPLNRDGTYSFALCPPQDWAPKLRRLCLYSCDLDSNSIISSLTHLALVDIRIQLVHVRIKSILSVCRALQSLHLDDLTDYDHPDGAPSRFSLPKPTTLPDCRHLRRVSLRRLENYLVSFFCSLVLAEQPEFVLQLLETWQNHSHGRRRPSYPPFPNGISRFAIGLYPSHPNGPIYRFLWAMTACGTRHTLRATAKALQDIAGPVLLDATAAFADVRELWLSNVSAQTSASPSPNQTALLKAVIATMPSLDTVVLANHFHASWPLSGRPSLSLLPDARSPIPWPRITTLRIVYGSGPRIWEGGDDGHLRAVYCDWLDLNGILYELASGAYDYLEHLVIEVPHGVYVDDEDVVRLRGYFKTTRIVVVDETPTMALPEYCVEPAAWPRHVDEPWPYRIW
ncbi:uncharacterized protein TRAVEDRAFT_42635 [Trametes versicolor FP-101664 SS1]|uniref:uncharacterized protein n=1 Tax=Trametes versicolor (strain FP-101664) TaxID=717944 RepID=UPI0004623A5D|nr:uncharacterized protein TRAVEDRAFT_42635 [Trametes versicolor FP-101664 SS1]EIW65257.1 hypothetical protein TRAVEDRAFT_42635 [Trametes versicolor FP-101664 SS1]